MSDKEEEKSFCTNSVVLLHGYKQNAAIIERTFSDKIVRGAKHRWPTSYIIPNGIPLSDHSVSLSSSPEARMWWPIASPETFATPHRYEGVDAAVARAWSCITEHIAKSSSQQQHVHHLTLVGFSQGAVLAMLMTMLKDRWPTHDDGSLRVHIDRLVLIAPSPIMDSVYHPHLDALISVPTFIIHGERDPFVSADSVAQVARYFGTAVVYAHAQGHVIPTGAHVREKMRTFLSASDISVGDV